MELPDQKIIDTIQSRVVSQDEFNYDHLMARPLYSMVSQSDIDEVYRIATSIRLAGNPRKRYKLIDEVMHNRGFRKLSAGTNRVAYTYFEDPSIVVKVAVDKVAIMDNPREFVNQHKLKPFCTKVFEVDPSGTMGVFERVKPITSREEYLTVASDVFEMLDMITSKYVLADIGTKFFMNIGIRKNFGVVLLDFPYLYEINDPNSLVCKRPDINSPGGFCGGLIDYDECFNTLRCNKCGAIYRAQELGSYLKTNKVIMKGTGKMDAKIRVSFTKNGKKYEVGNAVKPDIIKEESPVIKHIEEKPQTTSGNTIKVRVIGKKNFSYDVNTKEPNVDKTEYNFGSNMRRKSQQHNNPVPVTTDKENRPKIPFARFSKVNNRNNLVFTVKINNSIHEIVVDPSRIPNDAKKLFITDFENLSNNAHELEKAKSDILDLEEKLLATSADREEKINMLNDAYRENETLQAQIKDLEEELNNSTIKEDRIKELEDANNKLAEAEAEASDKIAELQAQIDNMKEEIIGYNSQNESLRNALTTAQNNVNDLTDENQSIKEVLEQYQGSDPEPVETSSEYTVEENEDSEEEESNNIYFMNAVHAKLEDIMKVTGKKVNFEENSDISKDTEIILFRDNEGGFLSDFDNNIFAGVNLAELEISRSEENSKE